MALLALLQERTATDKNSNEEELEQSNGRLVLIGCTHLWWNNKLEEQQLAELKELENEVREMQQRMERKYGALLQGKQVPVYA